MRLAQPPGVRSCRDGGVWELADDEDGRSFWPTELDSVIALTTSQVDAKLLKAELHNRMSKATVGGLKFGAHSDVTQMTLRPSVLEIRLSRHTGDFGTSMLVRLYFTEPAHVGGLMLVLLLAAKSPGPIGLVEQNDHVAQADRRADDWSRRHR